MNEAGGRPIAVLHVDDDPGFLETSARLLERDDGIEVTTETSVTDALDRLANGTEVDCIVSDYRMAETNGLEFLETVREDHPDLPFVLFTGEGSEEVAEKALTYGATDYIRKETGTDQYELLANRIRNAVEQYRASRRVAELDRTRTLVRDINRALVRASSREEIERDVCEIVSDTDPYRFAWIGEVDPDTNRIEPRASAGVEDGYLDEITVTADERSTGRGPGGRAVRNGDVAVSQNVDDDPGFAQWREEAGERGYRAVAAVPLTYDDSEFGILAVYADRARAFDEAERDLLEELGDDVAHAIHTIVTRERLRQEHERWAALFENAPRPVIEGEVAADGDRHVVRGANEAFSEVFGYDPDEIAGNDVRNVLVPEGERTSHAELRDRVTAGDPVTTEVERATANGRREFLLDVIPYGTDDRPADGWYGWYTDVTERKEREQRLQRQKEKIEALHDVATEIETCDTADAVYELIVDAAESILEFDIAIADEVTNGTLVPMAVSSDLSGEQYYDETPIDTEDNLAARAYRRGESSVVTDLRTHDVAPADPTFRSALTVPIGDYGVFQTVAETTGAFDDDDRELVELLASHARAQLRQIEREAQLRDRTEELTRQNERLDEFASIVSHDLRNPLNVAQGRLELARDDPDGGHFDEVSSALDRMERLIEDLLTLAREGTQADDVESVALPTIVDTCWGTVATADATLAADVERTILADPDRLRQLLENLFRNAVEHGGDDVRVVVEELADGFAVADDGPGIPDDERDRVFESGYSTTGGGTGFGLAIAREVAEAHDWEIRATDAETGGARFEITGVEFVDGA